MGIKSLAIVCFEDPRHVTGGVQRRVAAEVKYFAEQGVKVTVICEGQGAAHKEGNVEYYTVSTPLILYPLRTMIFSVRAARLLRSLRRFDVVETHHDAGLAGLLCTGYLRRNGTKWVEVVHGVFADELASVRHFSGLFSRATLAAGGLLPLCIVEKAAVRRADATVVVSEYAAKQVIARYKVAKRLIHVLPNGIDAECYSPSSEPVAGTNKNCEIVYVGRWHARKGVSQLLLAFDTALQTVPNLRLTLIGGGPLEASLRAGAERMGIASRVTFKSGLSDTQIVAAYRTADMVCVPSLQEGQGIVALEAQACGAPIVATRAGGLAEAVLDGDTGLLVEPGDVQALANALAAMGTNSEMRGRFKVRAACWAKSFAWPDMLCGVNALYEQIVLEIA